MHLPELFIPTEKEPFIIGNTEIEIPRCHVTFNRWKIDPIKNTFGNKPLIDVRSKPMFAELAIMKEFEKDGWETRWVEVYGTIEPKCMIDWLDVSYKDQTHVPFTDETINSLLAAIAKENNNSYSGCWDVIAKKDEQIIFAESKRLKKDKIRGTQVKWLEAALKCGLKPENFLVVGWNYF